eukprot:TRINITY_DN25723_c0_g1_i1.p1 TRINITY_DN25723_c0_g1~~TRINITY_DN25723_c0_g1_i1.p1  ORF type:complete len:411 (+),score=72.55 TRINITY_DN25723_c0_g1_i1:24-1256(+)
MHRFPTECRNDPVKLRQTYLRLALAHHPDKVVGKNVSAKGEVDTGLLDAATKEFQAIQSAYEELLGLRAAQPGGAKPPRVRSAFAAACELGDVEAVKGLLKQGSSIVGQADELGVTPLMFAARGGSVEVCQLLLEAAADATAQNPLGWTALTWAVLDGRVEAASYLASAGTTVLDNDLIVSLFTGNWETFQVLLKHSGGAERIQAVRDSKKKGLLHFALTGFAYLKRSPADHMRCVELVMEGGCDPETEDRQAVALRASDTPADPTGADFATPCYTAFKDGQGVPLLVHLLSSMTSDWAQPGLDHSLVHHHVIRRLCSLKADPWAKGPDGRDAVYIAQRRGLHRIAALLQTGASHEVRWDERELDLAWAASKAALGTPAPTYSQCLLRWLRPLQNFCSSICLDPRELVQT